VLPRAWDTAAAALTACANALGDRRGVAEVAARSGLAFRVSADSRISLAGPHAYPFAEVLPAAAARLGYRCELVSSTERPGSALHGEAQLRALQLIGTGRPTLLWGVHAPEFGLALGVEGDRLRVSGILDGAAPPHMPCAALGRGDVPIVFALQLSEAAPTDETAMLEAALLFGRGPAPTLQGFHSGQAAWRAVLAALESGHFDPAGLAYGAQRWAESRAAAAALLDGEAKKHFARAAAMLGELAQLHPFPPPPGTMLTSSLRDQSAELAREAARAEAAGLDAIADALRARERRSVSALTLRPLDAATLPDLFACIRELPLELDGEAALCREKGNLSGHLLYQDERLVAHLLHAPLEDAQQPIVADGKRWFLYCPWVAHELRGRGAGPRLMAALVESARAAGVDGLLTLATADERFLYVEALAKLGFVEVGRRDDTYLMELALTDAPSRARFAEPAPSEVRVVVRHAYHCPLLVHTRRGLAAAARQAAVSLDESDAGYAGARIDGREIPHGPIPAAALLAHLSR
jgi:ribosomal protein S18 acetylase RimI-like enzyme